MKIYVGRWDLLPEEWEGIPDVYKVTVREDDVTEKYGMSWRKTLLTVTKD